MTDDVPDFLKGKRGETFDVLDRPTRDQKIDKAAAMSMIAIRPPRETIPEPKTRRDPDWLLKGTPRNVQIEALRRSYYGYAYNDGDMREGPNGFSWVRDDEQYFHPIPGWGHLLEMRLGKTPTMLNEFELFRRDHGLKWMLIPAPSKFKETWTTEAERFGSSVPAMTWDASNKKGIQKFIRDNEKHGGIIPVNYEAFGYESTGEILQDIAGPETYIGADESILAKNPQGEQFKGLLKLAKRCKVRRISTGKPIAQGPHDLWAQYRLLGALDGWQYNVFKTYFCKMGGFKGKAVVGSLHEDELQQAIDYSGWVARRVDWMTTPGKEYAEREITMIREQKSVYEQMERDFIAELENGTIISADQVVTKLMKLQQISSGFIIDEFGKAHDIMPVSVNPKAQELLRMLREEISGKTIVIAYHRRSIDILTELLNEFNPATIRGQQQNVTEEKARFNQDPNCRVIIGQTKSIKYGHTLMGTPDDPCFTEIFYENTYSLDDRSQNEERAQGEGQVYPITMWDFIASERDRAPIEALRRKEDVASAVLGYMRSTGVLPRLAL